MPGYFVLLLTVINLVTHKVGARFTLHHNHHEPRHPMMPCPGLTHPRHGVVSCHHRGSRVPCHDGTSPGTIADYECDAHYVAAPSRIAECLPNGTWSSRDVKCVAECGKSNGFVSLVVNGAVASPGTFPWQVAIYNRESDGRYGFWCGGSLISEFSVITAAHCAWKVPRKDLIVAVGKFFRDFDVKEDDAQKIRVRRIEMLGSYQDVGGNYNGDLSVLLLEKSVRINSIVRPVCIDWDQTHVEDQLIDGNLGVVLGWGLTENDTFSDTLKSLRMPVKSDEDCIAEQRKDFRKFVTYTSFCAGFGNGSGVCNGDSGGGLSFLDRRDDRWYLQGVVSVSPRRRSTAVCDPNYYTVFTKVTVFVKWLDRMRRLERDMIRAGDVREDVDPDENGDGNDIRRRRRRAPDH